MSSTIPLPRVTRSRSVGLVAETTRVPSVDVAKTPGNKTTTRTVPIAFTINPQLTARDHSIRLLPNDLTRKPSGISSRDLRLINLKQQYLRQLQNDHAAQAPNNHIQTSAFQATAIFAQEAAGTAVFIDPSGLLLTCSHCIAETQAELDKHKSRPVPLLTAQGHLILTRCISWDPKRDLALLRVTAAQTDPTSQSPTPIRFHHLPISPNTPKTKSAIMCIGHPSSEDLESLTPGIKTEYPVVSISHGRFLGYARGQDRQDNGEIGALMHDAWTYWGHSGAPLVDVRTGWLFGVHSSWDEGTGVRRGVGVEAVHAFLGEVEVL